MKKALIMYHHGLGDIIMLTPHLRYLYQQGYKVDLMCRKQVTTSHLLDACPYTDKMFEIESPWRSKIGYHRQVAFNLVYFNALKYKYDWFGCCLHKIHKGTKIDTNGTELGLNVADRKTEVFINEKTKADAKDYLKNREFIFQHTDIEFHPINTWKDSGEWIKDNLLDLPIINTGKDKSHYMKFDINMAFEIIKSAKQIAVSNSVFYHACMAMDLEIDVVYFGNEDRKVWYDDMNKIKNINECGRWIK